VKTLKDLFSRLAARGPGPVAATLILWLVAEVVAFWAVVQAIGVSGAVMVGLLTSLAGLALFRMIGRQAVEGLKNAAEGQNPREGAFLDGTLAAIGATLLILPGFASDFVGLALASPSARGWLARRFAPSFVKRAAPGVIDLDPDDWRPAPDPAGPRIDHRQIVIVESVETVRSQPK
jgi:UPF0716 protein FxsA